MPGMVRRPEASLGRMLTRCGSRKPQAGNADVFASVTGVHDGMPLTDSAASSGSRDPPPASRARSTSLSAHCSGNSS